MLPTARIAAYFLLGNPFRKKTADGRLPDFKGFGIRLQNQSVGLFAANNREELPKQPFGLFHIFQNLHFQCIDAVEFLLVAQFVQETDIQTLAV